jgi:hypothetical protein
MMEIAHGKTDSNFYSWPTQKKNISVGITLYS